MTKSTTGSNANNSTGTGFTGNGVSQVRDIVYSIAVCAFISAMITVIAGGGLMMIGENEFAFHLPLFIALVVCLLFMRYVFPNVFDMAKSFAGTLLQMIH